VSGQQLPSALSESLATESPSTAAFSWAGLAEDASSSLDRIRIGKRLGRLDQFLAEPDPGKALGLWLANTRCTAKDQIARRLNQDVAIIDRLLNDQINAILHAPRFQKLEAAWRGLVYLVARADYEDDAAIKIRVLNVSWRDLERDFERAIEFDQSQLFRKVYEGEFGAPGGEPFGVIIGDYEIHPRPTSDHLHDDVRMLESLSSVAAAAFCPFILNASPTMFGMDDFSRLEHSLDHERTLEGVEYLKWKSLRSREDSRFLGLALPRVLMRPPYEDHGRRMDGFRFFEDVRSSDRSKYLWGGANYALAGVLIRAFAQCGWLADIRGARRGIDGGGMVADLPRHSVATDAHGIVTKSSTDVVITERLEKQLSDLGFIALCESNEAQTSVFFSSHSVQKPAQYDRKPATLNARMSSMLQYMLCVSRFAHYVKMLGRDKLGSFTEYEDLEGLLQSWIVQYVTPDNEANAATKARYPLRDAEVRIEPTPGKPGSFRCIMRLSPHYELDELQASVRVVAEMTPLSTAAS
jgi:type VI secretion system ImpC/EvpB family protein